MIGFKPLTKKNSIVFLLLIYLVIINYLSYGIEERLITILIISFFSFLLLFALNSISKTIYLLFLLLIIFVNITFYIASSLFGKLEFSHYATLYYTDTNESFSYLKSIPLILLLKSTALVLPFIIFYKYSLPKVNLKYALSLIIGVCMFSCLKLFMDWNYLIRENNKNYIYRTIYITPFRKLLEVKGFFFLVNKELEEQKKLQKTPPSWKIIKNEKNEKITVIIIGESVRKDFLQIYNHKLTNTPFLKSINKIQFQNAIAYGGQTMTSLSHAFQDKINGKPYFPNNIITLTNQLNKQTFWFSNQGSIGYHDNVIATMGKQAKTNMFLSKGTFAFTSKDLKLFDLLKTNLTNNVNSVYFLHMIGSHVYTCDTTDGKYSTFIKTKTISCYAETIRIMDQLIKKIYTELKTTNQPFQIIYFSDHGQYISNSGEAYHCLDNKECYDIPLIIIDSELKENIYINQQRNLKDFLLLYQELLNIETSNIKKKYKFISEEKADNSNLLYNNLKYENLKDNPFVY